MMEVYVWKNFQVSPDLELTEVQDGLCCLDRNNVVNIISTDSTVDDEWIGKFTCRTPKNLYLSRLLQHIKVAVPPSLHLLSSSVKFISCSDSHILFSTDTAVYSVGIGFQGQLGLGEEVQSVESPQRVSSIPPGEFPRHIAVSNYHSCIVTNPYGYLYTFGCGAFYRLGHDNDDSDLYSPRRVDSLLAVGAWQENGKSQGVEKVSCSQWHTAVLSTGLRDVYAWGWNNFGQCSDEIEEESGEPSIKKPRTDDKEPTLGGAIYPRKKMIIHPERIASLDVLAEDEDEVAGLACGHRFTAFLTRRGNVLVLGQLGSTEIDNVDPGSEWWVTSFAPTSTESALFNPVAADTSAHLAATSRQLRYIHRVTESSSLSSSSLLSKSSTSVPQKMLVHSLPAQQLSAYQWSLAYVCHSSA